MTVVLLAINDRGDNGLSTTQVGSQPDFASTVLLPALVITSEVRLTFK
jgi:hypothetical protein